MKKSYLNPKRISKRFLIVLAFAIFLIVAGVIILQRVESIPYWQDLKISNIHLNGNNAEFSMNDGEIYKNGKEISRWFHKNEYDRTLRLALFFQWAKEDPLLFDPNLEKQQFDQTLGRLRKENEKTNEVFHFGFVNPVDFLKNFSDASEEYQIFSKEISEEKAEKFLSSIKKVQISYGTDSLRLGSLFDEIIAKGQGRNNLMFLGGSTNSNIGIFSQDFQKIKRNADLLGIEIDKREACLKNLRCERPATDFEKPVLQEKITTDIVIINKEDANAEQTQIENGPFLVNSSCWKKRDSSLVFEAVKCKNPEYCLDWPVLADGDFWAKIGNNGIEKALKDQGVLRRSQSSSAPYGCLDLTYKPKVRVIGYVLDKYKNEKIFDKNISSINDQKIKKELTTVWNEGEKYEKAFFDAQYPSDVALDSLGKYYAHVYKIIIENNIKEEILKERLLQRVNEIRGEIKDFSLIVDRSTFHQAKHLQKNFDFVKNVANAKSYYVYDVLAIRSDYSIMFLNFSPFIWRTQEKPQYFMSHDFKPGSLVGIKDEDNPMIDYDAALELYGKDNLEKWAEISPQINRGS